MKSVLSWIVGGQSHPLKAACSCCSKPRAKRSPPPPPAGRRLLISYYSNKQPLFPGGFLACGKMAYSHPLMKLFVIHLWLSTRFPGPKCRVSQQVQLSSTHWIKQRLSHKHCCDTLRSGSQMLEVKHGLPQSLSRFSISFRDLPLAVSVVR